MELLNSEDVLAAKEPEIEKPVGKVGKSLGHKESAETTITINEFEVGEELRDLLKDIHDLTLGGMDVQGYRSYTAGHPKADYEVTYYVKGITVIMVDYHGTNTMTLQVLGRKETEWFINNVREAFGVQELNN